MGPSTLGEVGWRMIAPSEALEVVIEPGINPNLNEQIAYMTTYCLENINTGGAIK